MKNLIFGFSLSMLLLIISCGEDNLTVVEDPSVQRAIDIELIEKYLQDAGYADVDTTDSGVRYLIVEEGAGEVIEESDIVTFNYVGRLLSDTIFDTSIKTVVDSVIAAVTADMIGREDTILHDLILANFPEIDEDTPLDVTYSASGWPFSGQLIPGFTDGLVAIFNRKNSKVARIGGKALIVIPSDLAYAASGITYYDGETFLIKPNAPIVFEIYPIKIQKQ